MTTDNSIQKLWLLLVMRSHALKWAHFSPSQATVRILYLWGPSQTCLESPKWFLESWTDILTLIFNLMYVSCYRICNILVTLKCFTNLSDHVWLLSMMRRSTVQHPLLSSICYRYWLIPIKLHCPLIALILIFSLPIKWRGFLNMMSRSLYNNKHSETQRLGLWYPTQCVYKNLIFF